MSRVEPLPRATRGGPPWRRNHGLIVICAMCLFAVGLLVLSVFGDQGIFRIRQFGRDRLLLEQRVQSIEKENAALRRQLKDIKEGRASYELAARERLGLVKPGEVIYDFRSDPLVAGR